MFVPALCHLVWQWPTRSGTSEVFTSRAYRLLQYFHQKGKQVELHEVGGG